MGYPFLCESVSSVFLVLGAPLRTACLLPQLVALFAVLGFAFLLARELLELEGAIGRIWPTPVMVHASLFHHPA